MDNQAILIIEDEPKVSGFIKSGLESSGYKTDVAQDGRTGQAMALSNNYNAIILDVNLPLLNGLEVCRAVRSHGLKIPILMLSALGTTDDKVNGFETGTDDYLVKPFEFRELLARLRSMIKRFKAVDDRNQVLKTSGLELDLESKTVKRDGKKIDLTAKEFHLLEYLLINKGKVISKAEIAEKIWGITFDSGTNVIEVYINFLRKKIDKDFPVKLIHTHIGMGYMIQADE